MIWSLLKVVYDTLNAFLSESYIIVCYLDIVLCTLVCTLPGYGEYTVYDVMYFLTSVPYAYKFSMDIIFTKSRICRALFSRNHLLSTLILHFDCF